MALKDITLGQYFPGNSLLHQFDPRSKILFTVLFIAAIFLCKGLVSYGITLLILLIIVIAGVGTFAFVHSIRTRRRQLYRLAYVDPLTNGDNFACFKEKLSHRGGDSGFYVALDLQDFKLINNTCGVAKCDETLLEVWKILQTGTHLG